MLGLLRSLFTKRRLRSTRREVAPARVAMRGRKPFAIAEHLKQFWSGKSFDRQDEGNKLSYDLARIIVEQLARDWASFKRFVLRSNGADSGAAAARNCLGLDLGDVVLSLLERKSSRSWSPNPLAW